MPRGTIFHPNMLAHLGDFYPDTCTIIENTADQSGTGHVTPSWGTLSGHGGLGCAVFTMGEDEIRRRWATFADVDKVIALQGYYPDITPSHKVTHNSTRYNIVGVESDGYDQMTYLGVRLVRATS